MAVVRRLLDGDRGVGGGEVRRVVEGERVVDFERVLDFDREVGAAGDITRVEEVERAVGLAGERESAREVERGGCILDDILLVMSFFPTTQEL